MLKFVFLLTIYHSDGSVNVTAADTALTGEDCIARLEWQYEKDPHHAEGVPSCEIDFGPAWAEEAGFNTEA